MGFGRGNIGEIYFPLKITISAPGPTRSRIPPTCAGLHSHEHTELDERFEQLTYLAEAEKELAEMLGMCPVELRLKNLPEKNPMTGQPFSATRLADCLRDGAERFGWKDLEHTAGRLSWHEYPDGG